MCSIDLGSFVGSFFKVLGDVASVITIFGGAYLVKEYWDAKRTTKSLIKHDEKLQKIIEGLSTRSRGRFPDYLPKVAAAISRAEKSIKIMGIAGSHGSYTAKAQWAEIEHAVLKKIDQKLVKEKSSTFRASLLYGSQNCFLDAFKVHHSGLNDANDWEKWKLTEEDHLADLLHGAPKHITFGSLTLTDYLFLRLTNDRNAINSAYGRFELKECGDALPMYCWIIDDNFAIFSVRTEDKFGHYSGTSVSTYDRVLVEGLTNLFNHYDQLPSTVEVKGAFVDVDGFQTHSAKWL
jgi:hypothetical protein